ncbi:acetyl-CoA synthetase-like protein [Polyplosphaeria fusca]|uniref:Acetyl-CoA synthetase-like protein n=1 Tax=Polyplosphaeria fusca TaxID=682080 RepID=A0A9P4QP41_9PLEO|nr:acetyl-CoA synthetase-like protein [Polyplosphaeria fusca]
MAALEGFTGGEVALPAVDMISFVYDGGNMNWERPIYYDAADTSRYYSKAKACKVVRQLVAGFRMNGLQPGDCVLVNSFNDEINYTPIVQGIIGAGGIFTGASPAYTFTEISHQMKVAEIKFVITEPELLPNILKAARKANIPNERIWILNNLQSQGKPAGFHAWTDLLSHGEQDWVRITAPQKLASTVACRLMSSGTTGPSKAVNISHQNLMAQYHGVVPPNQCPYERRFVLGSPVFHAAMVPQMHFYHFRDGREVYLYRRFDLNETLRKVAEVRATELILVPAMVIMILADYQANGYDLSSLRSVLIGSAPLDKSIQERFRKVLNPGTRVIQGWGMSEMCCTGTQFNWPEDDSTGSVGRPIPGIDFMLLDKEGNMFREYDKEGELLVRGAMVTQGYHQNPKANAESQLNGWFRTGDICLCDSKSKLWYIVGRAKELIKVRGMQVAPIEIEAILMTHPEIIDAAVIGVEFSAGADQGLSSAEVLRRQASGEIIVAYVVPRKGTKETPLTDDEVVRYAAERLANFKRITGGVRLVDEIPKNAYGKILRHVLKTLYEKEHMGKVVNKARL